MDYTESVAYIHSFPRLAKTGDHQRILALLHALGDPQNEAIIFMSLGQMVKAQPPMPLPISLKQAV